MSSAPPCAACGYPLRWIPESNGWGCDRCRQFYPAEPQPRPQAQPHAAYAYSGAVQHARPGASKLGLWVAVGLLVIAGGVVGLVFALRVGGGASSPDELIKETLAAEAAGDVDALLALSDPQALFDLAFDCKGEAARDDGLDPKKQLAKLREQMTELVKTTKGLAIELVESKREETKPNDTVEKPVKGCTAKVSMQLVGYSLKLKVKAADGKSGEHTTELKMFDVDGHYFLYQPPRVKLGTDTAAMIAEMTAFKDKMCACKDKACADKVMADMAAWEAKQQHNRDGMVDADTTIKLVDVQGGITKCMQAVAQPAVDVPPPQPAPPPPSVELVEAPSDVPQVCKDYRAMLVKLRGCASYTRSTVDAMTWNALMEKWPKGRRSTRKNCELVLSDLKKSTRDCP